jgi:hypothetical protein
LSGETPNTEVEKQISDANAWVSITRTGDTKPPNGEPGALVMINYQEMSNQLQKLATSNDEMKSYMQTMESHIQKVEKRLDVEIREREHGNLIIANQVVEIQNILSENKMLRRENDKLRDA